MLWEMSLMLKAIKREKKKSNNKYVLCGAQPQLLAYKRKNKTIHKNWVATESRLGNGIAK
jgi:hypothetical protein